MADSDKVHDPTPRRRQQARAAGRVAHSPELASTVLLFGSLGLLVLLGAGLLEFLAETLRGGLGGGSWRAWIDEGQSGSHAVAAQWNDLAPALAQTLLPVLGGAAAVGAAVHLLQTGFLFRAERVAPDFSRASPLAGLGRLFSGGSAARLVLGVAKLGVVAAAALLSLWNRREELASLARLDLETMSARLWDACLDTCLMVGGALLVLAIVDYGYQRWKLERELRMTPQELREELRELEGDPRVRARRRELAASTSPTVRIDRSEGRE
jgi:flagellar biosynthetic protein FlhB